jgi:Na+/melibiose symporter-like transporter
MNDKDSAPRTLSLWRLGLPALPLSFVALPLYMFWPHHVATQFGVSLALLGGLLFVARLFDALIDPALGLWADRLLAHSAQRLLKRCLLAATLLAMSFVFLFFPQWLLGYTLSLDALLLLLSALLVVCYSAYSFLNIALQSWGARLGGDTVQRSRLVAWREGLGLLGVVMASVIPSWLGLHVLVSVMVLLMALALWAWWEAPRPAPSAQAQVDWRVLLAPWRHTGFKRLLLVFLCNGIASAIPATLILFFVQDRLQLPPETQMQFLGAYFLAAALSFPFWLRLIAVWGLQRSWMLGMGLAVLVFVWTLALGAGDAWAFTLVCLGSGWALGADLIVPSALLNGLLLQDDGEQGHSGAFYGWWQVATKLNLALAAGLALPLLGWLGYAPGAQDAPALLALSWTYALLPCVLKIGAMMLLLRSRAHLSKENP